MSLAGVQFPADASGKRSTLAGGKLVFGAAAAAVDSGLAAAISAEKNWRQAYAPHLVRLMEVAAKSPANAIKMAEAGLQALYASFEFVGRDGLAVRLDDAMAKPSAAHALSTGEIRGAEAPSLALEVPYEGKSLTGPALEAQLRTWSSFGCMEPDCAAALSSLAGGGSAALDLRGKVFVVMGATSALARCTLCFVGAPQLSLSRVASPTIGRSLSRLRVHLQAHSSSLSGSQRKPRLVTRCSLRLRAQT